MSESEQYLHAVLDNFKKKALEYFATTDVDTSERVRVNMVKNSLRNISFEGFTIGSENYGCQLGQVCRGGVCVDVDLPFEWSDRDGIVPLPPSPDVQ
ncbi:MAG: hypothetical protein KA368_13200 [Acidobacteria bacterium]|nr:hypothetical protein [Acidobacteriota bacterium]